MAGNVKFLDIVGVGYLIRKILLLSHPVGSYYWSEVDTDPKDLFGGEWVPITDTFVMAAGSSYSAGSSGGSSTHKHGTSGHTLTTNELPSHAHGLNSHTHSVGAHSHGLNGHTHSVGAHSHGLNGHTHSFSGSASHSHGCSTSGYKFVTTNGGGLSEGKAWKDSTTGSYWSLWATANVDFAALSNTDSASVSISGTTGGNSGSTANSAAFNTGGNSGSTANSAAFNTGGASGNTANAGGGESHSHGDTTSVSSLPPYVTAYCWKRVA